MVEDTPVSDSSRFWMLHVAFFSSVCSDADALHISGVSEQRAQLAYQREC